MQPDTKYGSTKTCSGLANWFQSIEGLIVLVAKGETWILEMNGHVTITREQLNILGVVSRTFGGNIQ